MSEWISTEDRLPGCNFHKVLGYASKSKYRGDPAKREIMIVEHFEDAGWQCLGDSKYSTLDTEVDVFYWIPLPKEPQ